MVFPDPQCPRVSSVGVTRLPWVAAHMCGLPASPSSPPCELRETRHHLVWFLPVLPAFTGCRALLGPTPSILLRTHRIPSSFPDQLLSVLGSPFLSPSGPQIKGSPPPCSVSIPPLPRPRSPLPGPLFISCDLYPSIIHLFSQFFWP